MEWLISLLVFLITSPLAGIFPPGDSVDWLPSCSVEQTVTLGVMGAHDSYRPVGPNDPIFDCWVGQPEILEFAYLAASHVR